MIVALPQPIRGSTHIRVEQLTQYGARQIVVRMQGGTLSEEEFIPDTDLAPVERTIFSQDIDEFNTFYQADTWLSIDTTPPLEVHARKILRFIWGKEAATRNLDPTLPA